MCFSFFTLTGCGDDERPEDDEDNGRSRGRG